MVPMVLNFESWSKRRGNKGRLGRVDGVGDQMVEEGVGKTIPPKPNLQWDSPHVENP